MTMLHVRAQVSFHGDYAIVSELQSKVTILDKNNVPVAYRRQPAAEPVGELPAQSRQYFHKRFQCSAWVLYRPRGEYLRV